MTQQYQQYQTSGNANAMLNQNDPWNTEKENNMTKTEAVATFKGAQQNDPWLVLHGENVSELNAMVREVNESGDFLSNLGALAGKFKAGAFQVGQHLGGESVVPHQNQEQLGIQQAPPTNPQPQQTSPQQSYQPQQSTAPTPVPASPPSDGTPQGPFIPALGMNATYKEGQNARGPWRAWFDPRPFQSVKGISQSTDDENHPGIAAGTHKFAKFIR